MKVLDLFSGIGGFSIAAHWMGWQTVAFVEQNKFCQKVLRKNFGQDIEIHDDIFKFSGQSFRGRIDIITGGFPCQPFSAAGKREGRDDERHLWPEMLRVISEVRPRFVVAENVRGLLSIESGRVFAEIITSLESEGYEVITFCIPASAVEAPHRRDRLWIVGRTNVNDSESGGRNFRVRKHERTVTREVNAFSNSNQNATDTFDQRRIGRGEQGADTDDARRPSGVQSKDALQRSGDATNSESPNGDGLQERAGTAYTITGQPNSHTSDAQGVGRGYLSGCSGQSQIQVRTQGNGGNGWSANWLDVAARTCVRGVDDGTSPELDIIGSRDNRVPRLKALGNAIVPQIAFEIFQAIEMVDG